MQFFQFFISQRKTNKKNVAVQPKTFFKIIIIFWFNGQTEKLIIHLALVWSFSSACSLPMPLRPPSSAHSYFPFTSYPLETSYTLPCWHLLTLPLLSGPLLFSSSLSSVSLTHQHGYCASSSPFSILDGPTTLLFTKPHNISFQLFSFLVPAILAVAKEKTWQNLAPSLKSILSTPYPGLGHLSSGLLQLPLPLILQLPTCSLPIQIIFLVCHSNNPGRLQHSSRQILGDWTRRGVLSDFSFCGSLSS